MSPWLLWGVIPALWIARELLRLHRERYLEAELRRLQWREKFADVRDDTVRLIAADKLDPRSTSAEMLYAGSSVFVRRAHDYDGFARSVLLHLLSENMPDEKHAKLLRKELEANEAVRELVIRYATLTMNLACERSALVRFLVRADSRKVHRRHRHRPAQQKTAWYRSTPIYRELSESRRLANRSRQLSQLVGATC